MGGMRSLHCWLVFGLLSGGCLSLGWAKDDAAAFAADLARNHIEMIGGPAKVEALAALRAEGFVTISGAKLDFVLWAQRPHRVRVQTGVDSMQITQGYDGVNAPWIQVGDAHVIEQKPEEAVAFVRDAEFDDPFYRAKERGLLMHYEGVVQVAGQEWLSVRVIAPTGVSKWYLDKKYMLVRRDVKRIIRGNEVVEETHYADFRPVDGVLLPHLIETRVGNNILHTTTLTRIEPNPFLLPEFFRRP